MSNTTIINATPHSISLANAEGDVVAEFAPSGIVARCATTTEEVGTLAGFPVKRTSFGAVHGLPEEKEGTIYIVSLLVAQALKGVRNDVVSPLTDTTAIRKDGQVVAVRGFQMA